MWTCKSKAPPLLLVEVKPHPQHHDAEFLDLLGAKVSRQTVEQAQYTFESSPSVQVIGVIQALGYKWRYLEYKRSELPKLPSLSEGNDPSYNPDTDSGTNITGEHDVFSDHSSPVQHPISQDLPPFIKPYFGEKKFLDLVDDYNESKEALHMIGEHIYNTFDERCEVVLYSLFATSS